MVTARADATRYAGEPLGPATPRRTVTSPTTVPGVDVQGTTTMVTTQTTLLRDACAKLPSLVDQSGKLNTSAINELAVACRGAGTVVSLLIEQYEYHDAGLLVLFAGELATARTAFLSEASALGLRTNVTPRLATMLKDLATEFDTLRSRLRLAAADYDIAALLPSNLKALLPAWFASRIPTPAAGEVRLLLKRMENTFSQHMTYFDQTLRQAKTPTTVDLVTLGAATEKQIVTSASLASILQSRWRSGLVSGSFTVLDDTTFVAQYVKDFYQRNSQTLPAKLFWRVIPVSEVDNVEGFQSNGTMYLHAGRVSTQLCVHEAMHQIAESLTRTGRLTRLLVPLVGLTLVAVGVVTVLHPSPVRAPGLLMGPDEPDGTDASVRGDATHSHGSRSGRPGAGPSGTTTGRPGFASLRPTGTGSPTPSGTQGLPPPLPLTIEAEDPGNTLTGSAVVVAAAGASGGSIVDGLGKLDPGAGSVSFPDVVVANSGTYVLTLYYAAPNDYTADVWVDGGVAIPAFARAHAGCCGSVQVSVTLHAGVNTISVGNPVAPSPAIDRIVIS
jgi:hypothetical protein